MSSAPRPATASLRVLLVDDEPLARQRLHDLLEDQPDVSDVVAAEDVDEAVRLIRETDPDVVLLDMQMPGGTGLDVVRQIGVGFMPITVFVTAHDEYAVQAFELAAADYLLKPFSDERFEAAFRRVRERVEMEDMGSLREQLKLVLEAGATDGPDDTSYLKRIAVQGRGRMLVVSVEEIDHIVANGVYAELHTGRESHLVRTSLSTLEARLDPQRFFRIHRSAIVSLDEVEMLIREGGGSCLVQLKGGARLPVSRSRREELELRLGRL